MQNLSSPSDTATLLAVVIGAVLATVGGFAATQLEGVMRRRERERSAALLFGEILSLLQLVLGLANQAREIGEPYGPVTMRLLRAVQREVDIYDRNRESLYDLRDAAIRAQIHTVMARMTVALDGVFDCDTQITALELSAPTAVTEARLELLRERQASAFQFVLETSERIKPTLDALGPLARQSFEAHAALVRAV